jgi:hypothetical protein
MEKATAKRLFHVTAKARKFRCHNSQVGIGKEEFANIDICRLEGD